ncbi:ClbS/DfsB family four-helix bundle protein [Tistrella bauzanensis]
MARPWYKTRTLGRMIQLNTASPYRNARGRLRRWMAGRGPPTSPRRAAVAAPHAEQEVHVSRSGPPARHDRCR